MVYKKNCDKGDLFENLRLYISENLKGEDPGLREIEEILVKGGLSWSLVSKAIGIMSDRGNKKWEIFEDARNLYEITGDLEDFCSTVKAFCK